MNSTAFHPGELVMVDIPGTRLDDDTAAFLAAHRIRAVCLFRKNLGTADEVRALTVDLRRVMGPGALIGLDQEGGAVVRATFLPHAPSAMALGAASDAALAEQVGAAVSRGLRSLGINWNFAPVLDVNNNPANPVIAERSFSEDPAEVARLAGAWMRGALKEGVACCVKHVPGHGDTHVDSHLDLPVVDKPRAALASLEFAPFQALAADAPAMMTAHIVYPQLDAEHPASLSQPVLTGLVRDTWGYDGVVITDSLVMKAIHDRYGHDRAAVLALQAGADMVMALGSRDDQAAAVRSVTAAFDRGAFPAGALQRSGERLNALARRYPAPVAPYLAAQRAADGALMNEAWARGLTTFGETRRPATGRPLRVVTQRVVACDGVSEAGLPGDRVAALFASHTDVDLVQLDDLAALEWASLPADGRFTVLVSNHRARYDHRAAGWRFDLHAAIWNPFQVLDVAAPAVVTWGYADGALEALAAWFAGQADATGIAPVSIAPRALSEK